MRFCKDIAKLVILGILDLHGYPHPNWYHQLVENYCVYLQAKNELPPPCFSGDIAKMCKLILGTSGMSGLKALMFICMLKIQFIVHFFLDILQFKESCNLMGQQHFCPSLKSHNFVRSGIGGEISITILVFILDFPIKNY